MRRHQTAGIRGQKTVVDQQYYAFVFRRADDPPGGLQDLVHPGEAVGIIKPGAACFLKMRAQLFLPGAYLRQARAYDGCADQPFPGKVDTLTKHAAQYGKAQQRAPRRGGKLCQKIRAARLIHRSILPQRFHFWVRSAKHLAHLFKIIVAGEKRQIIPCASLYHLIQQRGDLLHAVRAVFVPGADVPRAPQP